MIVHLYAQVPTTFPTHTHTHTLHYIYDMREHADVRDQVSDKKWKSDLWTLAAAHSPALIWQLEDEETGEELNWQTT